MHFNFLIKNSNLVYTLFSPNCREGSRLSEQRHPKKKKKTCVNTFEVNVMLLITPIAILKQLPGIFLILKLSQGTFQKKIIRNKCKLLNWRKHMKCVLVIEIAIIIIRE